MLLYRLIHIQCGTNLWQFNGDEAASDTSMSAIDICIITISALPICSFCNSRNFLSMVSRAPKMQTSQSYRQVVL